MTINPQTSGVTLRVARPEDQELIQVLAELDSAQPLVGRKLLAFVDGWPVAALSLDDGHVVATPFAPTEEAVAMLRLRARQLRGIPARRRVAWRVRQPRLTPLRREG
jgi:hypothetical protein